MRNNKPLLCLAAVICGLFLFCSRSDVITGAGSSVVSDIDPALTDLGRGFVQINLRANAVDSAFSLPKGVSPLFSTQASGSLLFGVNGDGDTVAAHIQYGVRPFEAEGASALYSKGAPSDSLIGAYIYFLANDTLSETSEAALFPSDTLPGLTPVNRADKQQSCEDGGEGGCDGATDNRVGGKSFALGSALDSIRLPDSIARRIFGVRISKDTSELAAFAFSVVDYHGAMRKAHRPYVIVHVIKSENGSEVPVRDSIPGGFARFTVFENSAMAEARSIMPYSSQLTKRTAVFRVKLIGPLSTISGGEPVSYAGLLDSLASFGLSSKNSELLNAVAAVKHIPADSEESGSAPAQDGETAVLSGLIGNYKALFLDTLLTDEIILGLDSSALAGKRLLYNEFAATSSTAPTTPYNTHSFKGALRSAMDKYSNGTATSPYIYIYLRPVAENSAILWDRPPKIETVFTPSRSQ
ncbi:MAG: hypothetical protein LBH93_02725 [Chitinispirillales bacterium]|jgi:hypothetical protein|nr:hypothetical protein [Chitinispirillales bacterium]